jgi:hypothetical protein
MLVPGRPLSILLLYACRPETSTISSQMGWPEHFMRDPRLRCVPINLESSRAQRVVGAMRIVARKYDGVVLLHTVYSNAPYLEGFLLRILERVKAPAAYFVGNEYKLMPEKIALCRRLGVRLFVSMTPNPRIHAAYRQSLDCEVVCIPGGGLDPWLFSPTSVRKDRPLDLGLRASDEPLYFGHQERRAIVAHFEDVAPRQRLRVDLSFDEARRFTRVEYARFLNRCRAQIGTEGGTDYFDLEDGPRRAANAYLQAHPSADLAELKRECLDRWKPCPARMLTGRHVEAAATKTVQVLFEGEYNGYFQADRHYIPLRKDLRNSDEVLEKLRDDSYCDRIVDNAYEMVHAELTYERLINRFHEAFVRVL